MMTRFASRSRPYWASKVVIGITAQLAAQTAVNLAMTVGLMPITGLPLPFLSYGGSWLIMSCVLIGFLLNLHARRHEYY